MTSLVLLMGVAVASLIVGTTFGALLMATMVVSSRAALAHSTQRPGRNAP